MMPRLWRRHLLDVAALGLFDLREAGRVDVERVDVDQDLVVGDLHRVVDLPCGLRQHALGLDDAMGSEPVAFFHFRTSLSSLFAVRGRRREREADSRRVAAPFVASAPYASTPDDAAGALAAADAGAREADLLAALLELVDEGHDHAGAGVAERMAERDGAAVDVDDVGVEAELAGGEGGDAGEGLVQLGELHVAALSGRPSRGPSARPRSRRSP